VTRASAEEGHLPIPVGMTDDRRESIKRAAGQALAAGLTIAALTAVVALVSGSFDDTEVRVILTSIGFAITSSTASIGAAQRLGRTPALRLLGTATAALSGVTFVLLSLGLWTSDWGSEGIWRAFGCTAVLAVAGAHACLVLGARRTTDGEGVRLLVLAAVGLAVLDTVGALLPISGLAEDVAGDMAQLFAATLVLLVLTSVLPPILRRAQRAAAGGSQTAMQRFAGEVEAVAERIDELNRAPSNRAPEIRREVERLRDLARTFQA
jgi:hypothetical protein